MSEPKTCCDIPIRPKWRIRSGHDGQPRYVSICPECSKETSGEVNEEAKKLLRYALVNDLLAVDPAVDNVERIETKEEPEMVKALTQLMKSEDDNAVAMRIWFNFRYAFKKANQLGQPMNWADIEALIEAAMKRTRKEIASEDNKKMILGRFEVMLNRVREFMVKPDTDMKFCVEHQLPFFICPCPKE